jgi:hypothetical protein
MEEALDAASATTTTCDDLASEAVRISEEQEAVVKLLKVRQPDVVEDNRETYEVPSGGDDVLVLSCKGVGVWSDATKSDVQLELTVDSDGDEFVSYEPIDN